MVRTLRTLALVFVATMIVAVACAPSGPTPASAPTASIPASAPDEIVANPLTPEDARDLTVSYVSEHYDAAPDGVGDWAVENLTAEGLVGASRLQYSTRNKQGDCEWDGVVTLSFPIVAPEHTYYSVEIQVPSTGFQWEGKVDSKGHVTESQDTDADAKPPPPPLETDPSDMAKLTAGNLAFALDLYQVLRQKDGNLFYSPYSISQALAMTYAGAEGDTETQMAGTLHFTLPQSDLHAAFSDLDRQLATRGQGAQGKDRGGFQLKIVNAIWGQEGYPFLAEFLDLLDRFYDAGLYQLDFASAPEQARLTINDWVEEQTESRIKDLLPAGTIDAITRLVLTNAIYFNAAWADPFDPAQTKDGDFELLDGGTAVVPMMRQTEALGYAAGPDFQMVELAYDRHELSMIILLPEAGEFSAFEESLDSQRVNEILSSLGQKQVALQMPKFGFETDFMLKDALSELGMAQAFSSEADFSRMDGHRELFISDVVHKAFVDVDEAGTEAAAATTVVMRLKGVAEEPVEVVVDQPFIFLIRDLETGTILFMGRVLDPSL
jgi:serpin B